MKIYDDESKGPQLQSKTTVANVIIIIIMANAAVFVKLFSFALAIIGVIHLIYAIALFTEFKLHLLNFASEKYPSHVYTVVTLGIINLIASVFGCVGTCGKSQSLLGFHCLLLLILIGMQVSIM